MGIADLSSVLEIFGASSSSEENQKELYKEVLLMTLARASRSDANIHPVEIETIRQIMQRETGQDLTEADIRRAARPELYESVNLRKYLRSVQRQLKVEDRITIVQALADVIKSDTQISVLEIDFFNRVADALRITPAALIGLTA
jgi:uncharacterized tellurite resistance protein B-like protein